MEEALVEIYLAGVSVRRVEDRHREILGLCEGTKEDKESWRLFLRHLKEDGLKGGQLLASDKYLGLVESIPEFYPEGKEVSGHGEIEGILAGGGGAIGWVKCDRGVR